MSKNGAHNTGFSAHGDRVAALHRQGDQWRLVVVGTGDGTPSVLGAESIPYGETAQVRAALGRHGVERVLRIVSASACISRVIDIAGGDEESLVSSMSLRAEAELPMALPGHRRACGVIGGGEMGRAPSALLLGWAGECDEPRIEGASERWTSEVVALLGLVGGRASATLVYADRAAGSLAMVATVDSRSTVRAMREDGSSASAWEEAVSAAIAETRSRCAIDFLDDSEDVDTAAFPGVNAERAALLWTDTETSRRVRSNANGTVSDSDWLEMFGVSLGACLGYVSAGRTSRALYELQREAPRRQQTLIERSVAWVSNPRTGYLLLGVGLALLLLAPLGASFVRKELAHGRLARYEAALGEVDLTETVEHRRDLNKALEHLRLPMTKLVADIGRALPVGAQLENIDIIAGDRPKITISGVADSRELVTAFRATLEATDAFAAVSVPNQRPAPDDASRIAFDIHGSVAHPFVSERSLEDFRDETLAVRLYGERARKAGARQARNPDDTRGESSASSDLPATSSAAESASRDAGAGAVSERSDESARGANDESVQTTSRKDRFEGGTSGSDEREAEPIPPPLSDADIAKLDNVEAMREYGKRRKIARYPDVSDEDRERLLDEANRLKARAREARGGG